VALGLGGLAAGDGVAQVPGLGLVAAHEGAERRGGHDVGNVGVEIPRFLVLLLGLRCPRRERLLLLLLRRRHRRRCLALLALGVPLERTEGRGGRAARGLDGVVGGVPVRVYLSRPLPQKLRVLVAPDHEHQPTLEAAPEAELLPQLGLEVLPGGKKVLQEREKRFENGAARVV